MKTKTSLGRRACNIALAVTLAAGLVPMGATQALGEEIAAAASYTATYSGSQGPLTLTSGTYLFKNVSITGSAEHPSAVTVDGKVTINFEGTSTLNGRKASHGSPDIPAGAGIEVPAGSTLTIGGNGTLNVKGGDASNGENGRDGSSHASTSGDPYSRGGAGGRGGCGGGAGVGSKGAVPAENGGRALTTGEITVQDSLTLNARGGNGGAGGNGGKGSGSYFVTVLLVYEETAAGGGGGGGGGGGYPGADLGSGGAVGAAGGNGSGGMTQRNSTLNATQFSAFPAGGGGGGGAGYGGGGGGNSGRAAQKYSSVGVLTNPGYVVGGGAGGAPGVSGAPGGVDVDDRDISSKGGTSQRGGQAAPRSKYVVHTELPANGNDAPYAVNPFSTLYVSEAASVSGTYGAGGGAPSDLESVRTIYMYYLPTASITLQPDAFSYNGAEQRPSVRVQSASGVGLSSESFSTAIPPASTDAGTYEVTLTGFEDNTTPQFVTGEQTKEYTIAKGKRTATIQMDASTCNVGTVMYASLSENVDADVEWQVIEGADLCTTAMNGTSFEVTTTGAGTIRLQAKIAGTDNYEAYTAPAKTLSVQPAGADLFSFDGLTDQTFTGLPLKPAFTVHFGDTELVEGTDYTVAYKDNVDVGEATVTVTGKGDYVGSVDTWFEILPASIDQADFAAVHYGGGTPTLNPVVYTGAAQTSSLGQGSFNNGAYTLTEGVDYVVSYSEYVNAGPVDVVVTGIGNFQGTQDMGYEITPADIGAIEGLSIGALSTFEYAGADITPKPAVTLHGMELKEGVDYTLSYANNVNVGTAQVIITGMGNFIEGSSTGTTFDIGTAMLTVEPTTGLKKYSGAPDPEFTYTVTGAKGSDVPVMQDGGALARTEGEEPGQYGLSQGTVALDPDVPVNANYELRMQADPVYFTIEQFKAPDVVATIEGVMGDDDWYYQTPAKLVAPEGYLVSLTNKADDSTWHDAVDLPDGDGSTLGITYYLRQKTGDQLILEPKTMTYKQDTVAPTGRVVVNGSAAWQKLATSITFDRFFNEDLAVSLYSSDETSGERETAYHFSEFELTEQQLKELPDSAWTGAEGDLSEVQVSVEQKYIVYGRFKDIAGNCSYVSSGGLVLDKTNPAMVLSYDKNGIWTADKDATATVKIVDDLAGLKDRYVDYCYRMGSTSTDVQLLDLDAEGKASIGNLRDGDTTLVVSAVDNASNRTEQTVNVKKDTQDPTLEVSGDVTAYEQYKEVSLAALVGPSGVEKVEVQRRPYGDAVEEGGSWTDITSDYNDAQTHQVDENGTYYFRYKNRAGVWSNIASISFDTIDHTKPSVQLSAQFADDSSNYRAGAWTNRDIVISLTNGETNLGPTSFEYRMQDGGAWTTYQGDNASTVKVPVNRPGEWTLQFRIVSASGMKSGTEEFEVKLDKVNPTGEITTGTNTWTSLLSTLTFGLFFKETKTFTVTAQDTQSGPQRAQYLIVDGANAETLVNEESIEAFADQMGGWQSGVGTTATVQADPNKRYVVYAKVFDKAGNHSYLSTDGFIVDDQAPIIAVNNEDSLFDSRDGSGQAWSTDPQTELQVTVLDSLSGAKNLEYTFGTSASEQVSLADGASTSLELADGQYDIVLKAYDNAGNESTKTITMRRDSTAPEVRLTGNTESIALFQHVDIDPVFGVSGLKKVEQQFVEEGADADSVPWDDITDTYASGFDVGINGTLTVRMENNLGATAEASLVFENIHYVEPVATIKAVDEDGEELSGAGWKPQARVLIANDPQNVDGFSYEYQVDGGGGWTTGDAADIADGALSLAALEGEHVYEARVTNNGDPAHGKPAKTSETVSLTIKVDDTKPEGTLFAAAEGADLFACADLQAGASFDTAEGFAVSVRNLSDAEGSSGLASASYCVYASDPEKPLGTYPVTLDEVKGIFQNRWTSLTREQMDAVAAGGSVEVVPAKSSCQYVVYLRVQDVAGNTTYASTPLITVDGSAPTLSTRYTGSWLTTDQQSITVAVEDKLSGVEGGEYQITTYEGTTQNPVPFTFDENGKYAIPASSLPAGVSDVEVKAADRSGNQAEPLQVEAAADLVVPEVEAQGDTSASAGQPLVMLDVTVGASDVQKVEVEKKIAEPRMLTLAPRLGGQEREDITDSYSSGYRVQENGSYSFTVTNGAGIESNTSTLNFGNLENLPIPKIEAFTSDDGLAYVEGTYTDQTVLLHVTNATETMGTSVYECSSDGGATWLVIPPVENAYWVKLEATGIYDLQFKITSQLGAVSHIVDYQVKIDKDQPNFTYTLDPGDEALTNKPLKLSVTGESTSDLEYSFDGGKTYTDQSYAYVHSNGMVRVAVKNQADRTVQQRVDVDNLDMLQPQIENVSHETKNGVEVFALDAVDAPATTDYACSGMGEVFLTKIDPYAQGTLRSAPVASDVVLDATSAGRYTGSINLSSAANTGGDNVWVVATDAVGNASVYSVHYKPVVEPDQPGNPGNTGNAGGSGRPGNSGVIGGDNNSTVSDVPGDAAGEVGPDDSDDGAANEALSAEEKAQAEAAAAVELQNEKADAVLAHVREAGGDSSLQGIAQEMQLIQELLSGNLSPEKRAELEAALGNLQVQYWGRVFTFALVFILIIGLEGALLIYLLKRRKKAREQVSGGPSEARGTSV